MYMDAHCTSCQTSLVLHSTSMLLPSTHHHVTSINYQHAAINPGNYIASFKAAVNAKVKTMQYTFKGYANTCTTGKSS